MRYSVPKTSIRFISTDKAPSSLLTFPYNKRVEALGECLIPDCVLLEYIYSIIVSSEKDKKTIEEIVQRIRPNLKLRIEVRPGYFKNYLDRSPFYNPYRYS